ncbi:MAG: fatty acid desaturase family protein [Chthoniobacterales bacterium]
MSATLEQRALSVSDGDLYDQKVERFLDAATIKSLSKTKPWRGILQVAIEWLGIAAAIFICNRYWNPVLYVLTIMWIGARQNALAVLMHEAVHYRLLPNRKWNEWIGEVFTAWPVMVTVNGFRQTHWAHHRHVNKPDDPDWQRKQTELFRYPKSGLDMIFITLKYWIGFYAIKNFGEINNAPKISNGLKYTRLGFYLAVIIASIVFHFWVGLIIYWIVPLFTYFLWIIYVRGVAEHFGGIEHHHEDLLAMTRHVECNLFERLLIAPNYIHVHIGHHLYPSVPFYNLRKLQQLLMQNPDYARRAHVTYGYIGFLRELIGSGAKQLEPAYSRCRGNGR